MRLDEIRDYRLNLEEAGYGDEEGFLKEDTDLTVTGEEFLHAVVTMSIPGERLTEDYVGKNRGELIRRLSMVESFLDSQGEYLKKSPKIMGLDESERSLVSYYHGLFVTNMISRRVYKTDFLVSVKEIDRVSSPETGEKSWTRRNELIGKNISEEGYRVWAVRGRSNNSNQAITEGCEEAGAVLEVNGVAPIRADACMTYYGARCLSVKVKKAVKAKEGVRLTFSEVSYWRAYFDNVYRLMRESYETESIRNRIHLGKHEIEAIISVTGDRKLSISMPRDIFFAIYEKKEEELLEAVKKLESGTDGIQVRFLQS